MRLCKAEQGKRELCGSSQNAQPGIFRHCPTCPGEVERAKAVRDESRGESRTEAMEADYSNVQGRIATHMLKSFLAAAGG